MLQILHPSTILCKILLGWKGEGPEVTDSTSPALKNKPSFKDGLVLLLVTCLAAPAPSASRFGLTLVFRYRPV